MLTAELTGRNAGFGLAENTYDLFVGKTLLHGDVLMWLMKTLLTSRCINQRGAGHLLFFFLPNMYILALLQFSQKP
ncbi:TPA: hypothetical protein MHT89_25820 [Klebsiella pneumoniae]|nr:hypothetical protein [Klebsiella pneumoniae]MBK2543456.1 hypothetical protein [Klebsiella quasipneumoniae]HBY0570281.1 hypothetical protein [Klebsiella pneumoniae subsp. pneumoniae]MBK2627969.1 hypothetical protein [Klebsiella quasipneumoniae]MBK3029283.1 hypothetical protein [Klebsiella quasipneumoniae]